MRDLGESGMRVRLNQVLQPGMPFTYVYDYGSTTELKLKVIGLRNGSPRRGIELLAQNDAPQSPADDAASSRQLESALIAYTKAADGFAMPAPKTTSAAPRCACRS